MAVRKCRHCGADVAVQEKSAKEVYFSCTGCGHHYTKVFAGKGG
jgi:DNA-directed RNA polymerase subunit RPC12/RpoP